MIHGSAPRFLKKQCWFNAFFLLFCSHNYGAIIISGQPATDDQPFPFTVQATAYDPYATILFIGANEPIAQDQYKSQAISYAERNKTSVIGITPATLSVNNTAGKSNPLYGQQINFLAASGNIPFTAPADLFVVTAGQPNQVSFIRHATHDTMRAVFQSKPLTDVNNQVTSGIVALTALPGGNVKVTENMALAGNNRFCAAIAPNGGVFGEPGSGIAAGALIVKDEGNKTKDQETINVQYYLNQILTYALDGSSSALKIGPDNVTINPTSVVMESSVTLDCFFTGLFVQSGPNADDGAIAVTLNGNGAIVPASAIEKNSIIGGLGAKVQVSIYFLKTLKTSSRLDYLIVVGGVGAPDTTAQSVYALPLTQSGYLAQKNAVPVEVYEPTVGFLQDRYFPDTEAAVEPGQLFSPNSPDICEAQVGGNGVLPGPITAIFAEKDAVFVSVGNDSTTEKAGIFVSQMILDPLGREQGWTDWRRAAGTTDTIFGLDFDAVNGTFWYFPGTNADSLTILNKMIFSPNPDICLSLISQFKRHLQLQQYKIKEYKDCLILPKKIPHLLSRLALVFHC